MTNTKILKAQIETISEAEYNERVYEALQYTNSGTAVGGIFAKAMCLCLMAMPVFVAATEISSLKFL